MILRRTALALAMALVLNACGGDDSADTGTTGNTGTNPSTPTTSSGVFVDSPVAGIHYQTATQSGETDAEGRFNYLPGEMVTFSIGGITLPAVEANEMVTPLSVFETSDFTDQRVVNLGRLLQSLDDDGDLDNGIQIASVAHSAATGLTLDFNVPTSTFEAQNVITNLLANGGGSVTLISAEEAIAHMQDELAERDLSLVGSWYIQDDSDLITITFLADGSYLIAEASPDDDDGQAGVEYGTYLWDSITGALTAQALVDTNGEWGLSHPLGQMSITRDGDQISFSEAGDTDAPTVLQQVVADAENPIVGTWMVDGQEEGELSIFVFLPNGDFTLAETGTADDSGGPGIERGTYTWNANDNSFSAEISINTNGEWGISDEGFVSVQVDADSMTAMGEEDEAVTLTRLP